MTASLAADKSSEKSFPVHLRKNCAGLLPRIAGNAGNHGKDGKFYKSNQILNQTKRNINKLCLGKISRHKTVRINFSVDFGFSNELYGQKRKPRNVRNQ